MPPQGLKTKCHLNGASETTFQVQGKYFASIFLQETYLIYNILQYNLALIALLIVGKQLRLSTLKVYPIQILLCHFLPNMPMHLHLYSQVQNLIRKL